MCEGGGGGEGEDTAGSEDGVQSPGMPRQHSELVFQMAFIQMALSKREKMYLQIYCLILLH